MPAFKPPFPVLQRGRPLAQGLGLDLPFYEGSGKTVNDLACRGSAGAAGQGAYGTLNGNVTWSGSPYGSALSFGGTTSDYVSGTGLDLAGTPFSIAVTFQYTGSNGCLFSLGSASFSTRVTLYLQVASSFQFQFGMYNDDHVFSYALDDFVSGEWYQAVFTMDSSFAERVYRNGKLSSSSPASAGGFFVGNTTFNVGRRIDDASSPWVGPVGSVVAWNYALSADEVAALYADSFARHRRRSWRLKAAGAAGPAPQGWQEWESPPVVRRLRENRNVIPY